jgi:DMSO/TMAO reductase YedYZ molybdopterin-dependent catalytic subunit
MSMTQRVGASAASRISGPLAALIEFVSIVAALGAGQLAAELIAPASAPLQAVADTVIRLAPQSLVEVGKSLEYPVFGLGQGVADKVSLLVGVAVVVVVVAVVAGLSSRDRPLPGRAAIVLLGVLGLAAVVDSPVFTPRSLVAPLVAAGVGLAVHAWLYRSAAHSVTTGPVGARRRLLAGIVLAGAGGLTAGIAAPLLAAAARSRAALTARLIPTQPAPPIPPGADFAALGTPSFLTANRDFYRIDTALRIPTIDAADWSLRVHGMLERELHLTYADLLAEPLIEKTITLTCVSNEVNGNLISTANFTGVSLRELLARTGVHPDADQVLSTSLDGWTAGTPTQAVVPPDSDALLAVGMNGQPLPPEHGYPVRMIVPGLYGYVSATKWLTELELTTFAATQAYWAQRGWAQKAPIKTQSRIDRPRPFQTLSRNRERLVTLAGIAWAQTRGIQRVEVRLDQTGPWHPTQLSTPSQRQHLAHVAHRPTPGPRQPLHPMPSHRRHQRHPTRSTRATHPQRRRRLARHPIRRRLTPHGPSIPPVGLPRRGYGGWLE